MKTQLTGFTLIELLVAISIIAIVAATGFATYSQVQILGRDSRRKQDLRSIATALQLYYQTNKRYPCPGDNTWLWSTAGGSWITDIGYSSNCNASTRIDLDTNYISRVPIDPTNNANPLWTIGNYSYGYRGNCAACGCPTSLNGQWYLLATQLENHNDPDRNAVRQVKDCSGSPILTIGWDYSYVISSVD